MLRHAAVEDDADRRIEGIAVGTRGVRCRRRLVCLAGSKLLRGRLLRRFHGFDFRARHFQRLRGRQRLLSHCFGVGFQLLDPRFERVQPVWLCGRGGMGRCSNGGQKA